MASNLKAHNSVQGGDVLGTRKIGVTQGEALEVAEASFNPGYDLGTTFNAGYIDKACLTHGYTDYGVGVGEESSIRK